MILPGKPIYWPLTPPSKQPGRVKPEEALRLSPRRSKSLAVQTARATEEIAAQIQAVQGSTSGAVDAIRRITARMQEIDQYTSSVATSVSRQSTATSEISCNVEGAAQRTKEVSSILEKIVGAVAGRTVPRAGPKSVTARKRQLWICGKKWKLRKVRSKREYAASPLNVRFGSFAAADGLSPAKAKEDKLRE